MEPAAKSAGAADHALQLRIGAVRVRNLAGPLQLPFFHRNVHPYSSGAERCCGPGSCMARRTAMDTDGSGYASGSTGAVRVPDAWCSGVAPGDVSTGGAGWAEPAALDVRTLGAGVCVAVGRRGLAHVPADGDA